MNIEKYFDYMEETIASYRATLIQTMRGEDDVAGRLIRWVIENDISPYDIFASPYHAECFGSITGLYYLSSELYHAMEDDGEIFYVLVDDQPLIMLDPCLPNWERSYDNIKEYLMKQSSGWNYVFKDRSGILPDYKLPTIVVKSFDMENFVSDYNDYQKKMVERRGWNEEWIKHG